MTQYYRCSRLNSLRRAAARVSRFPDQGPEGWHKTVIDPMDLLAIFRPLRLNPGFVLRAYSFREGGNGNALVYAMPVDTAFPEPQDCPRASGHFLEPPVPPGALADVMDAIEGDGSPWSYMCASLFARELGEFGALWHGCSWSTHTIIGDNPAIEPIDSDDASDPEDWTWLEPQPEEWRPCVAERDGRITVMFYSHSALGGERVVRHVDTYEPGSYRFASEEAVIATGKAGTCFSFFSRSYISSTHKRPHI